MTSEEKETPVLTKVMINTILIALQTTREYLFLQEDDDTPVLWSGAMSRAFKDLEQVESWANTLMKSPEMKLHRNGENTLPTVEGLYWLVNESYESFDPGQWINFVDGKFYMFGVFSPKGLGKDYINNHFNRWYGPFRSPME